VAEVSKLLDTYVKSVIAHADEEDADSATKGFLAAAECYCKLCEHGEAGVNALRELLTHDRIEVRQSAAYHILPLEPMSGLRALKRCAKEPSVQVGLSSDMTIRLWVSGKLTFPMSIQGKVTWVPPELVARNLGNAGGTTVAFVDDRQPQHGVIGKTSHMLRSASGIAKRWFLVLIA